MNDLIFVVKGDGTYALVPNKNLRAQENYSDNFVVIANRVGVVKAKIKLLSRTDKVEVKYLVPSLESVEDLIGDKPFFQDYANASVWRGAVPKKLLQEISMSYAGNVEVSFSFLKAVLDSRATELLGELQDGEDLPQSATEGDYFIIRYASYTANDITWTYGQTAIWVNGEWVKGGTYQVIGTTTTHRMNVEQTLVGEQAEFDTDQADEIMGALSEMATDIHELDGIVGDHELRIVTNEQDIDDIESGATIVEKANRDAQGNVIHSTYATQNTLDQAIENIEDGTTIAKKAEYAEKDESGRKIESTYLKRVELDAPTTTDEVVSVAYTNKSGNDTTTFSSGITLPKATTSTAGVMTAADKTKLDGAEVKANKGQANGYAPLDANTKVPLLYLYDSVLGQLEYVGSFDGNSVPTMTQNLSPNRPVRKGDYFIANGNGVVGSTDFKVGDWLIFDSPTTWQKIDNTDAVASVNGKMGVVVLNGTDIEVGGGDTTTLQAKIVDIYTALGDRYTKLQTYNKTEIDALINSLKAIYGWESAELGELITENAIEVGGYDMVYIQAYTTDDKIDAVPLYLKELDDDYVVNVGTATVIYDHILQELQVDTNSGYNAIKISGFKMEQQKAENITFENSDVDTELKRLGNEKADKVDLINHQDLVKSEVIILVNGFTNAQADMTGGWFAVGGNVGFLNNEMTYLANNATNRAYVSDFSFSGSSKYYLGMMVKSTSDLVRAFITGYHTTAPFHSGSGNYEHLSYIVDIALATSTTIRIQDTRTSNWDDVFVKKAVVVNLTAVFGAGNEPTKEQFDKMLLDLDENYFFMDDIELTIPFDEKELVLWNGVSLSSEKAKNVKALELFDYRPLRDKKIVCFGDSITQGNTETDTYTFHLQERLKAKVYNVGFGGTRMATHSSGKYDYFGGHKLIDAIISQDFTAQDNSTLTEDENSIYRKHLDLLMSIDFNEVDYVSVFYGANDYAGGNNLDNELDDQDRDTYAGATRYFLDQLLTNFPHIKVILTTPTWRSRISSGDDKDADNFPNANGVYLYEYADKMMEVGKEFKLPVLDIYYNNIISLYTHTIYLADGLHTNDNGAVLLSNRISAFIENY